MAKQPPYEGDIFKKGARLVNGLASYAQKSSDQLVELAGGLADGGFGFNGRNPPSQSGSTTRQGQVPPKRDAVDTRQVMRWMIPEQPIVEMYINPSSVQYNHKKLITKTRVKGGYSLQYWGEDLISLSVSGTTGTSGMEGINVLMDVYRNEQLMFDPYALFIEAERDKAQQQNFDSLLFGDGGPFGLENAPVIGDILSNSVSQIDGAIQSNVINSRNKPTLASMAFTVELYWSGEVYRGFFENFTYDEKADRLGLFEYNFTFQVTQKRGFRNNFLGWHKHPSYGQSNWDYGGPPQSFGRLMPEYVTSLKPRFDQPSGLQEIEDSYNALKNDLRNMEASDFIDAFLI
jgi:hypothetical protein